MTCTIKFKNESLMVYNWVIAFFYKDNKILLRFSNRDLKLDLGKINHFEVYDYD